MKIDPKLLGRTLLSRIDKCGCDMYAKGRGENTVAVFNILRSLARQYGLVFYPYKARSRKELLCDFMWLEKPFRQLVLAAECEWKIGKAKRNLVEDFKKLFLVRAQIRVFIYRIPPNSPPNRARRVRNRLAKELHKFADHRRGDYYLLLEIDRRARRSRAYYYRVCREGSITMPTFSPLGETAAKEG